MNWERAHAQSYLWMVIAHDNTQPKWNRMLKETTKSDTSSFVWTEPFHLNKNSFIKWRSDVHWKIAPKLKFTFQSSYSLSFEEKSFGNFFHSCLDSSLRFQVIYLVGCCRLCGFFLNLVHISPRAASLWPRMLQTDHIDKQLQYPVMRMTNAHTSHIFYNINADKL